MELNQKSKVKDNNLTPFCPSISVPCSLLTPASFPVQPKSTDPLKCCFLEQSYCFVTLWPTLLVCLKCSYAATIMLDCMCASEDVCLWTGERSICMQIYLCVWKCAAVKLMNHRQRRWCQTLRCCVSSKQPVLLSAANCISAYIFVCRFWHLLEFPSAYCGYHYMKVLFVIFLKQIKATTCKLFPVWNQETAELTETNPLILSARVVVWNRTWTPKTAAVEDNLASWLSTVLRLLFLYWKTQRLGLHTLHIFDTKV